MSVEKHRNRLLLRSLAAKTVSDVLTGFAEVLSAVARTIEWASDSAHALEHDAATRYENLTGSNLGEALNEPARYRPEDRRGIEIEARDEDDEP